MKTDADKSPKEKKTNLIITALRFAGARLLIFFAAAELIIQSCLQKSGRRVPHVLLFVLQSGLLAAVALYCMGRPKMDLLVCLGITAFVAAFLLLCFPLLYRKKTFGRHYRA